MSQNSPSPYDQANNPFQSSSASGPVSFGRPAAPPPSQSSSGCGCWVIGLIAAGLGLLVLVVIGVAMIGFLVVRRSAPMPPQPQVQEWPGQPPQIQPGGMGIPPLGFPGQGMGTLPGTPAPEPLPPLADPAPPTQALPLVMSRPEGVFPVGDLEPNSAQTFDERAPQGGVLVGLRLTKGTNWGGAICGVQAIYQVADKYTLGATAGPGGGVQQQEFLAKPGYAVGMIQCRVGLSLNAVRIEFRRAEGQGLVADDSYQTDWYGCEGGREMPAIDGQGSFLVGVRGGWHSDLTNLASYRLLALGTPPAPLPVLAAAPNVERTQAGNAFGEEFTDTAPEGGLLVGFRVFQGVNWGGAIRGIQPVYQVGDRYELGKSAGKPGGTIFQLLAPAGFAVGKIEADTGLVFDGLLVTWHRVKEDGTLDPTEAKSSQYVGVRGGQVTQLDSRGAPIRGIFGRFQEDLNQLGIATAKP